MIETYLFLVAATCAQARLGSESALTLQGFLIHMCVIVRVYKLDYGNLNLACGC